MTRSDDALRDVLRLAKARHIAITGDDFEAYSATDEAMALACERLLAADEDYLAQDPGTLNEVLALETASSRALGTLAAGVSTRLGELSARGRTNSAYLRSERSSVNGL